MILQFCRCGGLFDAKGNPDGFLSHFSSLRNFRLGIFSTVRDAGSFRSRHRFIYAADLLNVLDQAVAAVVSLIDHGERAVVLLILEGKEAVILVHDTPKRLEIITGRRVIFCRFLATEEKEKTEEKDDNKDE